MANPRQGDFATRENAKFQQRFRAQSKNAVTDASLLGQLAPSRHPKSFPKGPFHQSPRTSIKRAKQEIRLHV